VISSLLLTRRNFVICNSVANIATGNLGANKSNKGERLNTQATLIVNMAVVEDAASVLEQFVQDGTIRTFSVT